MKTIGAVVVIVTLVFSAIAVVVFFTRDRHPPSSPIAQPDSSDDRHPSPLKEKPSEAAKPQPVQPPPPREPFVEASKEKVSKAMNEVIVKTTIANIKVAAAKGQNDMVDALAKGLKNYRPSAVKILEEDIPTVGDPAVKDRLEQILTMLKEENR